MLPVGRVGMVLCVMIPLVIAGPDRALREPASASNDSWESNRTEAPGEEARFLLT